MTALIPHGREAMSEEAERLKASTSIAFNYRAACRARSHAEFTAKMGTVAEESDETLGWLEFIDDARLMASPVPTSLVQEARELVAIFSATYGTARANQRDVR